VHRNFAFHSIALNRLYGADVAEVSPECNQIDRVLFTNLASGLALTPCPSLDEEVHRRNTEAQPQAANREASQHIADVMHTQINAAEANQQDQQNQTGG